MTWFQALVLGIVEGLTEYLPVSSTGHLILAQRMLGITNDTAAKAYAICIQAGAIVAVAGVMARRVGSVLRGLVGRDRDGLRLGLQVALAFVPAAVLGILLKKPIERHLFGLWPIVAAWLVGGIAILVVVRVPRLRRETAGEGRALEALTWGGALGIGLVQCLGMWPGTSRSLVTILGGLLVGLAMDAALEFSFLLGLLTLTGATMYAIHHDGAAMLRSYSMGTMLVGFVAAAVSAAVAVGWMLHYLRRRGFALFGWYRIALAIVVASLLLSGVLAAG